MSLRSPIIEGDGWALAQYVLDNEALVHIEVWGPLVRFAAAPDRVDLALSAAVWEQLRQHAAKYNPGDWAETDRTTSLDAEGADVEDGRW